MSKLQVAILGCGGMAGAHSARFKTNEDVEIAALCDVSEDIVTRFIDRTLSGYEPVPQIFTDPAVMYAQVKLDAVAIVTPHTQHYEQVVQALEAGLHVLIEKPMVTDSKQAHALAAKAKETGKIVCIAYNTPCTPEFKYLRDLVRSKELGRLQTISGWIGQNWKKGTVGLWRQDPLLSGGGMMYDSGAHLFNSLVWTVEQPVSQVQAFVDNSETPVDINGTVNIKFADGTLATIMVNGDTAPDGAGLVLCFEFGRVEVDGWGGSWIKVIKGRETVKYPPIVGESYTPNDNFIDAILGRAEPRTTPLNGINQSELMDAVYESARTETVARPTKR